MIIPVKTEGGSYNIYLERGALKKAGQYLSLDRKVLIVTDSGVPEEYSRAVAAQCREPFIVTNEAGEKTKNIDSFTRLLRCMVEYGFTRTDCVVAVGGGVTGDLSGFAASAFMRGIDFYNIPTTVLSQVDSSIGGKTAIDFMGYKNIVGAFYPPRAVIIDPDTLKTLEPRQISNGLAEALKMSLTNDGELFSLLENEDIASNIDLIIERALLIKKSVVEADEKETGLRRILNFGHTLAHAAESAGELEGLLHGECVAIGMLPMCAPDVRKRLLPVLKKLNLPTSLSIPVSELIDICRLDKKASGDTITVILVNEIGSAQMQRLTFPEYENLIKEGLTL